MKYSFYHKKERGRVGQTDHMLVNLFYMREMPVHMRYSWW